MNYYSFHIGDYASHTAHLEPMEDLAYRRMLDLYYRTQSALPLDVQRIARLIRMPDHAEIVQSILSEFFTETEKGWSNSRADSEIEAFQRMQDGGKKGAAKRWSKPGDSPPMPTPSPPQSNPNANHTQSHTQEPITKVETRTPNGSRLPQDWVLPEEWQAWAEKERPDLDVTLVACQFRDFWIAKPGKDGRKLDWQATWRNWIRSQRQAPQKPADVARVTVPARQGRDPTLERIEQDALMAAAPSEEIRAKLAELRRKG